MDGCVSFGYGKASGYWITNVMRSTHRPVAPWPALWQEPGLASPPLFPYGGAHGLESSTPNESGPALLLHCCLGLCCVLITSCVTSWSDKGRNGVIGAASCCGDESSIPLTDAILFVVLVVYYFRIWECFTCVIIYKNGLVVHTWVIALGCNSRPEKCGYQGTD